MYYDAYHQIINISNPNGEKQSYDVVGYLCEEDTFAHDRMLPQVREGDILALKNAGAYGMVMASHYNLRPLPKEIVVDGEMIIEY
jgi:diaminopimelate decarboxylase